MCWRAPAADWPRALASALASASAHAGTGARARAGEGGRTVDHWRLNLNSVERLKDMVIIFRDRLTASHIKRLELHPVKLFAVGVVFKEEDHKVSEIVAPVLGVFVCCFLNFMQDSEFCVRPSFVQLVVFFVTLDATNFARNQHFLHYGIQQPAQ